MNSEIPVRKINPIKKPRIWLAILITLLFLINIGLVGLFWFSKKKISEFTSSAQQAAQKSSKWSPFKASADIVLPSQDVAGEDLEDVPRFADSVRISVKEIDGIQTLEYQSLETPQKILQYYKTYLAQNSWLLKNSIENEIIFTKLKQEVTITAGLEKNSLTTYKITLKNQ